MEKPKEITLEVKTHQIEVGFKGGGKISIYREDTIDVENGKLVDGFKKFMYACSNPGFIEIKSQFYRPNHEIAYIQLKESAIINIVTLEKENSEHYKITNMD